MASDWLSSKAQHSRVPELKEVAAITVSKERRADLAGLKFARLDQPRYRQRSPLSV